MNFKIALLLSCIVTYTHAQFSVYSANVPTTQEYIEASSINTFRKPSNRQTLNGNNDESLLLQRPSLNNDYQSVNTFPLYYNNNNYFIRPVQSEQQPIASERFPSPQKNTLVNDPFERPHALRPLSSSQTTTRNPSNQQTTTSQQQPSSTQSRSFTSQRTRPTTQNIPVQTDAVYSMVSQFAWTLFKNANVNGQNFVSCPLSPQLLLSYLVLGSDGETQQELINAVGFQNPTPLTRLIQNMLRSGENRELQIATSFFVSDRTRLNQNFKQTATSNDVEILPVDFYNPDGFSQQYNQWVRSKTKGTFRPARVTFPANTKMIMSSAVFFKGEWIFKFNPAQPGLFFYEPGNSIQANMMTLRRKLQYGTLNNLGNWVAIPYNSSDMMIVFLPYEGKKVDDVIQALRIIDLVESINQDTYANVNLTLPKFKIETRSSLVEPLQRMGINRIFSPNSELTRLANGEQLQVNNALQQASLEVNEEGSIASSLTSFSVVALSFSPPTPDIEFIVNRPFIAMIVDKRNNYPYFIAKVMIPQ
ncbi:hypothetical protein PVAND_011358 [Polypedilum vanderplanki]|uniref:Serpin domain-containing protein n=1 Tax=Polypedilum vanderplanki TaxID=319348 RepID=A0A9J6CJ19_POLVA|nr:hypothetical protein PVAND_011358 [Polypedilum vanderplanki]